MRIRSWQGSVVLGGVVILAAGCGKSRREAILSAGSDTMVNVAQAWAETYSKESGIRIQVIGGGSGVGIASLIDGTCDIANTSRKMMPKELERARERRGAAPVEHIVGYDALAVFVHKDNPVDTISLDVLTEIYGEDGTITTWAQVSPEAADLGAIIRVSRQNNSGTYAYFREAILGKTRDYKGGSLDQSGSKDAVALVGRTAGAIGYSGMGYATDEVKMLKILKAGETEAIAATLENAKSGTYPITRPLYIYTLGEPQGIVKNYLDWIYGETGQGIVVQLGYVPLK